MRPSGKVISIAFSLQSEASQAATSAERGIGRIKGRTKMKAIDPMRSVSSSPRSFLVRLPHAADPVPIDSRRRRQAAKPRLPKPRHLAGLKAEGARFLRSSPSRATPIAAPAQRHEEPATRAIIGSASFRGPRRRCHRHIDLRALQSERQRWASFSSWPAVHRGPNSLSNSPAPRQEMFFQGLRF